jgi:diguanylate cyclase (GGDEF)-like protein
MPILGFTALFLVSARALNGRYEREHGELVALQHHLEQRVQERTKELEIANERLAEASRTDSLTGLLNRGAFLELADHEVKRARRANETFSIVMVDLDHFKEINDRHGHAGGDELLQAAAARLRSVLRDQDLVARWGGEEFILLLPGTDASGAAIAAENARSSLAAYEFQRNGTRETITASFGITEHQAERSLEATIALADQALYRAKERGRNRVA